MNRVIFYLVIFASLAICAFGQNSPSNQQAEISHDEVFYSDVNKWFNAWELVSQKIFKVNSLKPVELVFFDDKYVYSTSNVTIPDGETVKGPKFFGKSLVWKKALYKDSIRLPSNEVVPLGLMSFASGLHDGKSPSFFIMPLPSFWRKSGVDSAELGLQNLVTCVFLHEFSHSQQMENFGRTISEYEKAASFGVEFSDDIVQNLFAKDSGYTEAYNREAKTFFEAAAAKDKAAKIDLTQKGISLLRARQSEYFKEKYASLGEIDDFFLTMEGLGQFAMYAWLTHPRGGNIAPEKAFAGVRRSKKWWSQDEGFALFLLLASYEKPEKWAKGLFGTKTTSVIELLQSNSHIH